MSNQQKQAVVVLISGSGSNLQAIINDSQRPDSSYVIKAVISNRPDVQGLERARQAGIDALTLDHRQFADRASFDQALMTLIDQYHPALVVLAGFMRILSDGFVEHYIGRMLNIHPSLLPKYPGLNTHQRAIESGDEEHGASVHFVTQELDGGPVIIQASVPVLGTDTEESLAERVLAAEHRLYPLAISWFTQGILHLRGNTIYYDGHVLEHPKILEKCD